MIRAVFESINKVSHPGKWASWRHISRSFVLEFMSRDVNLWTQSCISCQWSKVQTHIKTPVQTHIKTPVQTHIKTPVQTHVKTPVHTHIKSPVRLLVLPQFCGFFICSLSLIIPQDGRRQSFLQFITAEDCVRVLLRSKITLFRVSSVKTFDRGAQFTGSIWSSLCKFQGTVSSPTTSFHPQSNGIVERFHHLPLVLLELRSVPSEDSSISSSEAVFGSPFVFFLASS